MEKKIFCINDYIRMIKQKSLLIRFSGDEKLTFSGFSYNSSQVSSGDVFICKGFSFKKEYLAEAIKKGAVGYISEFDYDCDLPLLLVRDARKSLALLSAMCYNTINAPIEVCGVTGTKGKSTTVYFIYNILKAAGIKTAYSTTVDMFDGVSSKEAILTTPEADVCQYNLRTAMDNGCEKFIMETSSQALKLSRIYNILFKYGVFVNISKDHISPHEHRDFEDYFSCKLDIVRLYENSVINADDPNYPRVLKACENAKKVLSYSIADSSRDIYASELKKNGFKSDFTVNLPDGISFPAQVRMPGVYNVSNALAAAGVAYLMGVSPEYIAEGIQNTKIPGRMEIFEQNGYTVIVDYAHNESSMSAALTAIKQYYPGKKISVVFGCPGGKGLQRRRDMAYESSLLADYVYITSEDPGSEDPRAIANEVMGYLNEYRTPGCIILDRKEALESAIAKMKHDEIVLVTGKGNEHYQLINSQAVFYESDTVLAKQYISQLK